LRITLIIALVVLTVEGWTGNSVNLFATFPSGSGYKLRFFSLMRKSIKWTKKESANY
jgi:hypothetical protein